MALLSTFLIILAISIFLSTVIVFYDKGKTGFGESFTGFGLMGLIIFTEIAWFTLLSIASHSVVAWISMPFWLAWTLLFLFGFLEIGVLIAVLGIGFIKLLFD